MQLFSFSASTGGYIETFVTLFSSAAINRDGPKYCNADIHEILSRISHYDYYKPEVAEKILEDQLFRGGYNSQADDAEKEETIYNAISQELLNNLEKERDEKIRLWNSKSEFEATLSKKNEEAYNSEMERHRNAEVIKSQRTEIDSLIKKEAERRFKRWRIGHIMCLIGGGLLIISGIIGTAFFLMQHLCNQANVLQIAQIIGSVVIGLLGLPLFRFVFKIATPNVKKETIEKYTLEVKSEL